MRCKHSFDCSASSFAKKNGGWITFPFTIATIAGLSLAAGGWSSNLIVFLINEFNMKGIATAKVFNVVNGLTTISPLLVGSLLTLILAGILLLLLTEAIDALRPLACDDGSNLCTNPSTNQYVFLYVALALASIGIAGTRFTIAPMGAYQFDKPRHQAMFFDWYICIFYLCWALSTAFVVYVEDNVSWAWVFGISQACNILGLAIFLAGKRFYRHVKEQGGSPFVNLARVVVAAIQKLRVPLAEQTQHYYHDPSDKTTLVPTKFFKFLKCAALITEGDTESDGSISNPRRLCTVQQVEDLKSLIKLFPLWASGLLISTQLVMQLSLLTLQALKMDRHMGPHFEIPAGSILVFILLFTSKYTSFSLTPLQRVGIGHALTIACMAVSALFESRQLMVARSHHLQGKKDAIVPISNTSTAMVSLFIGIDFYLGNVLIDLVQRQSGWLPDNINDGRMDNVFWLCCTLGSVNFIYFLVVASFYKYRNMDSKPNDIPSNDVLLVN
ncbi:unnamed protein product [Withania somnifera]